MRIDLSQNSVMLSVKPERAAATLRAFAARGIGAPRIVDGWRVTHTPHKAYPLSYAGNALNMLEIIMQAKRSALPYCVVYEDDAFPRLNAQKTLDAILAENPLPEDCGLLSLGDWNGNLESRIRRTLPLSHCGTPYTRIQRDVSECAGSHAFVVFSSSYIPYMQAIIECGVSDVAFGRLCHYGEKSAYALFRTPLFIQRHFPGEKRHHDMPEAYYGNIKQRDLDFPAVP